MSALFCLFMNGMLMAEPTIFSHFKSVGIVLFVFHCIIVSLLALSTSQCNFYSHLSHLQGLSKNQIYLKYNFISHFHIKKKTYSETINNLTYIFVKVKVFYMFVHKFFSLKSILIYVNLYVNRYKSFFI